VWTPPTYGWIDPQKEMAAYALAVQNGFMTHADVAALMGRDWQTVFEQLAVELAEKDRLGIPRAQAPGAAPTPEAEDDDEEEQEGEVGEEEGDDADAEEEEEAEEASV
jgi:capsid protein